MIDSRSSSTLILPSNHALNITQRHSSTTYSVAACLSRIADAEWLRTCEGVRRFSPTVGHLGEWRALCEGGWTGPVPQDLLDIDQPEQPQSDQEPEQVARPKDENRTQASTQGPVIPGNAEPLFASNSRDSTEYQQFGTRPPPGYSSSELEHEPEYFAPYPDSLQSKQPPNATLTNGQEQSRQTSTRHPPSSFEPPRPSFVDANTGSVRSLSAFPAPPTHYPIPPLIPRQSQTPASLSTESSRSNVNFPSSMPRLTESPLPEGPEDVTPELTDQPPSAQSHRGTQPPSPEQRYQGRPQGSEVSSSASPYVSESEGKRALPVRSQTSLPTPTDSRIGSGAGMLSISPNRTTNRSDSLGDEREFGIIGRKEESTPKARTMEIVKPKGVERTDTGESSGSIVAAMRNRYSNTVSSLRLILPP